MGEDHLLNFNGYFATIFICFFETWNQNVWFHNKYFNYFIIFSYDDVNCILLSKEISTKLTLSLEKIKTHFQLFELTANIHFWEYFLKTGYPFSMIKPFLFLGHFDWSLICQLEFSFLFIDYVICLISFFFFSFFHQDYQVLSQIWWIQMNFIFLILWDDHIIDSFPSSWHLWKLSVLFFILLKRWKFNLISKSRDFVLRDRSDGCGMSFYSHCLWLKNYFEDIPLKTCAKWLLRADKWSHIIL